MKFKVGDRVEFIENYSNWKKGDVVKVTGFWERYGGKGIYFIDDKQEIGHCLERRVKLYAKKKTKKERIAKLEKQVAVIPELEKQVAELLLLKDRVEQLGKLVEDYFKSLSTEVVEKTQDVQRRTVQCAEVKSPNQLRKEIIERAKKFVEDIMELISQMHGDETEYGELNTIGKQWVLEPVFYVNKKKRVVTVLLKGLCSGRIYGKAIAKCHQNDVFNEDIGKAIALGRALKIDVSEFENAVQPTYAAGQILSYILVDTEKIGRISYVNGTEIRLDNKKYIHSDRDKRYGLDKAKIIDDTNAEY